MAYRLGWSLYWICLALIPVWIVAPLVSSTINRYLVQETTVAVLIVWFGPAAFLYGLGRAFRYVFSAE
jgi:undecaprenyl pyrophosphate phosphatase UppP